MTYLLNILKNTSAVRCSHHYCQEQSCCVNCVILGRQSSGFLCWSTELLCPAVGECGHGIRPALTPVVLAFSFSSISRFKLEELSAVRGQFELNVNNAYFFIYFPTRKTEIYSNLLHPAQLCVSSSFCNLGDFVSLLPITEAFLYDSEANGKQFIIYPQR